MMSKKIIPVILVCTAASLFIAFKSQGSGNNENPKDRYEKILKNVGILLTQAHYNPKKIDDAFSKEVFAKFTEDIDDEKNIFLQADMESFKPFETIIDDEIRNKELESFYKMNEVYLKRLNEVSLLPNQILEKPFDFNKDETFVFDPKKKSFPKSEADRMNEWRKRIKYMTLSKYIDLKEEREKNKDKKDFVVKPDTTLEREARDYIRKQMSRFFTTKITRENTDENFSTFINAIVGNMDPHSNYFPPIDLRSFNESMSGHFYGIGAQLKEDDGKIKITSLVSGGPAWKSGELAENDEIIKVGQGNAEPVDVTGYSVSDAVKLIRGSEKGTVVSLTIRKADGNIKIVKLARDDIKLEDTFVKSAIIRGQYKIGYIYLPEFYADFERPDGARCFVDVAREIEKLKAENIDGIVMDLRGNGGGSLYDVIQMAGLFIADGPICQVKSRDDKPKVLFDSDNSVLYDGPLAVMVDETSASASEIFAAAIQDYKRGVIIGSTSTYGKGTVQRNIPLNPVSENKLLASLDNTEDLGTVKLTLQKFYRINGGSTQLRGVTPDIILPDRLEYLKFREKDNPVSLKWDEVKKADYKTWTSMVSSNEVINSYNKELNQNTTFNRIKTNVQWLEKMNNRTYSLNINKYLEEQKQLKNVGKELDSLYKLKTPMVVNNISVDLAAIQKEKDKMEKNDSWLKRVKEDVFIEESVKVLDKMIKQNNMARSN